MATATTDPGAYRISGRFGWGYYIDPSGARAPIQIIEATQIEFTPSIAVTDVPLAGNDTGSKDGVVSRTGTMAVQQIDAWWENIVTDAMPGNLAARRAARDAGKRVNRTFTLQVWQDDPEALGAIGYQLNSVRISEFTGGFNFSDDITSRTYAFRFGSFQRIKSFQRLGNQVDASTGLPAIQYLAADNSGQ